MSIIKEPIRQALFVVNENQAWLADQLGVHKQQLSRWINADRVNTDVVKRIADVFGHTPGDFLNLGSVDAAGKACCSEDA